MKKLQSLVIVIVRRRVLLDLFCAAITLLLLLSLGSCATTMPQPTSSSDSLLIIKVDTEIFFIGLAPCVDMVVKICRAHHVGLSDGNRSNNDPYPSRLRASLKQSLHDNGCSSLVRFLWNLLSPGWLPGCC